MPFTSFAHAPRPDRRPARGVFGGFAKRDGSTIVQVGILVNHLFVDGADLGNLHEALVGSFGRAF